MLTESLWIAMLAGPPDARIFKGLGAMLLHKDLATRKSDTAG
jgi:hypothetical protein